LSDRTDRFTIFSHHSHQKKVLELELLLKNGFL
jgi:hypothetical protein